MNPIFKSMFLVAGLSLAATLPYQGLATDAKNKPVADGNYTVKFSLYTNAASANPVWTESQSTTSTKGLFSTSLGLVNTIPDSLFNGTALYLGVAFNGGSEGGRALVGTNPWSTQSGRSGTSRHADSAGKVAGMTDSVAALRSALNKISSALSALDSVGKAHWADSARVALHLTGPDSISLRAARDSIRVLNRAVYNQNNALSGLIALMFPEIAWKSNIAYGSIVDARDGQVYRSVTIGSQTWLAQNLSFAGTPDAIVGSCPGNTRENCAKYGRTYTFPQAFNLSDSCMTKACAALISTKHQGACPVGWHLPDTTEWRSLSTTLDPATNAKFMIGEISTTAGGKLKALAGWTTPGTDEVGFRALPAGGYGGAPGRDGMWWVALEPSSGYGYRMQVDNTNSLLRYNVMKEEGAPLPVRCLKN
ncbi:MAG: hypothetical protein IPO40_18275 [Fibrobacteres bacterium]|nr:hypothetical protein [Fibrobacterota bacterium]